MNLQEYRSKLCDLIWGSISVFYLVDRKQSHLSTVRSEARNCNKSGGLIPSLPGRYNSEMSNMDIQILVGLISLCFNKHKSIDFCLKTSIDLFKCKSNIMNSRMATIPVVTIPLLVPLSSFPSLRKSDLFFLLMKFVCLWISCLCESGIQSGCMNTNFFLREIIQSEFCKLCSCPHEGTQ